MALLFISVTTAWSSTAGPSSSAAAAVCTAGSLPPAYSHSPLAPLLLLFSKQRPDGPAAPLPYGAYPGPLRCGDCGGSGWLRCRLCGGRGRLPKGGHRWRRNSVRLGRVVGTQWTRVEALGGKWRHFRAVGRRGRTAGAARVELCAACGPAADRVRLWVPLAELKDRAAWEPGWTTLREIRGQPREGAFCSRCGGGGEERCATCDGSGAVRLQL